MAIVYVETRSKNLPDSGAWQIHKFGTASGEQRIALEGSWITDRKLFDFYVEDVEFYFFTKSDMLEYISSIQEEIHHPTQEYYYKNYPAFYEEKKREIIEYPSNFMVTHFEANPRIGGTAYLASVSAEDSQMYNFLRSICLSSKKQGKKNAYTTLFFIKYQDTKTGKYYINLVPKFTKQYNMEELSIILKRTLEDANDVHVALSLFGLKYSDIIISGRYSCQDLIKGTGYEDNDLTETLKTAVQVYQELKEKEITINPISDKLDLLGAYIESNISKSSKNSENNQKYPLQQIFYGAPGTGKSHKTNEITREYSDTIRTTFHPDSDYSTFVGAYKPTTTEECVYGLNGDKTICFKDVFGKPLKTSKIEYKFIKQAFLKAYIRAWQKMCVEDASSADPLTFTNNAIYTIVGVDKDKVTYQKEHTFPKKLVESEWDKIWSNGPFLIPKGPQSGKSIQHAISLWIYNIKGSATTKDDFSAGWNKLIEQLQNEKKVEVQKSKIYELSYNDDTESVKVSSYANAGRDAIKKCYDGNNHRDSVEGITNILKSYNLPSFEEAWAQLSEDVTKGKNTNIMVNNTIEEQFLVIEEINRGNCAQIFGDIFQLLDRTDNGYSQYPIEADQDIQNALLEDSPKDGLSFGSEGLQLSDGIIEELNEIYKDFEDDIVSKICHGEVLVLPKNLHIWATMNTSDQSLFPIDSAFKRRWDWEYVPIQYANDKWMIDIQGNKYPWVAFQKEVNKRIYKINDSEDKMLGDFFVKADKNDVISHSVFLNKILFYLWNDVCKDGEGDIFKKDEKTDLTFSDLYGSDGTTNLIAMMEYLKVKPEGSDTKNESIVEDETTD